MGASTVLMASSFDLPKNVVGVIADCPFSSPKEIIIKFIESIDDFLKLNDNLEKNCTILFLNPAVIGIRSQMYEYLRIKYKASINLLVLDSVDCLPEKHTELLLELQNNFDNIFF